jgi:6,7-dimethyl-8-ribityllumazine synthase
MSKHTETLLNTNNLQVNNAQVVIVYTNWNSHIITPLLEGCISTLHKFDNIKTHLIEVPGCVEIPFAIKQHSRNNIADAYIALGCVIKGDTPHFDYVCQSTTQGITQLNLELKAPTIFGILTVNTEQQALDRIGGTNGHKGEEAAITALKMINISRS